MVALESTGAIAVRRRQLLNPTLLELLRAHRKINPPASQTEPARRIERLHPLPAWEVPRPLRGHANEKWW